MRWPFEHPDGASEEDVGLEAKLTLDEDAKMKYLEERTSQSEFRGKWVVKGTD